MYTYVYAAVHLLMALLSGSGAMNHAYSYSSPFATCAQCTAHFLLMCLIVIGPLLRSIESCTYHCDTQDL